MRFSQVLLAGTLLAFATGAAAQSRGPKSYLERQGTIYPSLESYVGFSDRTLEREAASLANKNALISYDYRNALRFASCVDHFDRAAADRLLAVSIGSTEDQRVLSRLAERNGPCVAKVQRMHSLLIRAALAEVKLRASGQTATARLAGVGVPASVNGYPLKAITQCQAVTRPDMVNSLLASEPGSVAEREAVARIFAQSPQCGPITMGRVTPTVARLALVDAAYQQRSAR
ncbi:hypothetical protein H9L12_09425 [Sphingomonas rhizophila]|uniref:Uncharacterized protein n=1 Tax=Sphingomonas rhizophila TaxID=2071607 RepID=A0A7G9S9K1_9SPHN|nr:hypothetical protein [Sphingomonas rhizophila]QNN64526.1 hypothetical protein H9L12_09425 [Sphingomonas rhizophila]